MLPASCSWVHGQTSHSLRHCHFLNIFTILPLGGTCVYHWLAKDYLGSAGIYHWVRCSDRVGSSWFCSSDTVRSCASSSVITWILNGSGLNSLSHDLLTLSICLMRQWPLCAVSKIALLFSRTARPLTPELIIYFGVSCQPHFARQLDQLEGLRGVCANLIKIDRKMEK